MSVQLHRIPLYMLWIWFCRKKHIFCFHCAHACSRVVYTITQCCVRSFCSSIQWLNRDRTRAAVPTIQSLAMILWCFLFTIIIGSTKQKREKSTKSIKEGATASEYRLSSVSPVHSLLARFPQSDGVTAEPLLPITDMPFSLRLVYDWSMCHVRHYLGEILHFHVEFGLNISDNTKTISPFSHRKPFRCVFVCNAAVRSNYNRINVTIGARDMTTVGKSFSRLLR